MNLPNKITTVRFCLIPVFVFFYMADFIPGGWGKLVAALVFAAACLTDFLDGKIARKYNLVTNLGKFLDSIADKVLVMAGIILACAYPVGDKPILAPEYIGITVAIVILARELIISALRQIAASQNIVLAADMYGKVKATFQFVTLIYYFIYAFLVQNGVVAGTGVANTVLGLVGYVLMAVTVILTILSAVNYLVKNKKVFKDAA